MPASAPLVGTAQPEGIEPAPDSAVPLDTCGVKPAGMVTPKLGACTTPPLPTLPMNAGAGTV